MMLMSYPTIFETSYSVSIIVPYCAGNDVGFRDLIAHEFGEKQFRNLGHSYINPKRAFLHLGHGILVAGNGIWHSLTHKGTSYFCQRTRPDAPIAGSGNSRLDVMYYYRDDPKPWNFARRRFLAEPDAQVFMDLLLLRYFRFGISIMLSTVSLFQTLQSRAATYVDDGECGGRLGSLCWKSSDCLDGLKCRFFK